MLKKYTKMHLNDKDCGFGHKKSADHSSHWQLKDMAN
jgi:hypothetical protein